MNTIEKIADDLGQIIFRLECNIGQFRVDSDHRAITTHLAVTTDLERLKEIKGRIIEIDESVRRMNRTTLEMVQAAAMFLPQAGTVLEDLRTSKT
jgi:hypothetical protein